MLNLLAKPYFPLSFLLSLLSLSLSSLIIGVLGTRPAKMLVGRGLNMVLTGVVLTVFYCMIDLMIQTKTYLSIYLYGFNIILLNI